jgi:hypothetical protein
VGARSTEALLPNRSDGGQQTSDRDSLVEAYGGVKMQELAQSANRKPVPRLYFQADLHRLAGLKNCVGHICGFHGGLHIMRPQDVRPFQN